jgi:glycosyltransferase involved in cell wall biosynthesis
VAIAPVPYKDGITVEGGGLRAWNLALGLSRAGKTIQLLTPQHPLELVVSPNLSIKSYESTSKLQELCSLSEAVIVHASHSQTANAFNEDFRKRHIIIVDAYVPIHIEYGSRIFDVQNNEEVAFETEYLILTRSYENTLREADYVVTCGSSQSDYYNGLCLGLNVFTVANYFQGRILNLPMGLEVSEMNKPNYELNNCIGWFGGFYPWLAPMNLPEIFEEILRRNPNLSLLIIGGINPFLSSSEPIRKYSENIMERLKKFGARITIVPWVDYSDFSKYYSKVDAVLTLNPVLIEAKYSWRTRVLDSIRNLTPIITDGNDQISRILIEQKAAIHFESSTPGSIAKSIAEMYSVDNSILYDTKKALQKAQEEFSNDTLVKTLTSMQLSKKVQRFSQSQVKELPKNRWLLRMYFIYKLTKSFAFKELYVLVKKYSAQRFNRFLARTLTRFIASSELSNCNYLIFTPSLGFGGANMVSAEISEIMNKRFRVGTITTETHKVPSLTSKKYKVSIFRGSELELLRHKVVINSVAHPKSLYNGIFEYFEKFGDLAEVIFYVHEDVPSLWINDELALKLSTLKKKYAQGFKICTPSLGTSRNLAKFLGLKFEEIDTIVYPVAASSFEFSDPKSRFENDQIIDFYICGTSSDSRKNHRKAIDIFEKVNQRENNRDFRLHFVGVGEDEYSRETVRIARDKLGDKFRLTGVQPHIETLTYIDKLHVCISISEFETLPRVVTEALLAGQPILRNSSSGQEEQLVNGSNGILIDENDSASSVNSIQEILNYDLYPKKKLVNYGEESLRIGSMMVEKSMKDIHYFE